MGKINQVAGRFGQKPEHADKNCFLNIVRCDNVMALSRWPQSAKSQTSGKTVGVNKNGHPAIVICEFILGGALRLDRSLSGQQKQPGMWLGSN